MVVKNLPNKDTVLIRGTCPEDHRVCYVIESKKYYCYDCEGWYVLPKLEINTQQEYYDSMDAQTYFSLAFE